MYNNVLIDGLPNWRQPIFYFRRARKLAMWQVSLILVAIISVGQYLAGWASYFEKRLSLVLYFFYRLTILFYVLHVLDFMKNL